MLWVAFAISTVFLTIEIAKWFLRKRVIRNYGNRYIVITGCNSGFGNLLAKQLDELGFNVFAGCHSDNGVEELNAATSERLCTFRLDVADPKSVYDAVELVKSAIPAGDGLWALINNAGTAGSLGPVDWLGRDDYLQSMTVNLFGLIDLTRSFLPLLRAGQGRVINMSSILTKLPVGPSPYILSKYAVEGFSDCLRLELFRQGVTVIIIQPGFYKTNLLPLDKMVTKYKESFNQASFEIQSFYGEEYLQTALQHCLKIHSMTSESLSDVTDACVHAVTSRFPHARYIVGRDAKLVSYLIWFLPEWMKVRLLTYSSLRPEGARRSHDRYCGCSR